MTDFNGVTIVKKANIYFDGKVTSRAVIFPDGTRKTLGIMLPGEYEFSTDENEIIEIISGNLDVSLPGQDGWKTVADGDTFEIPAKSKFGLKVKTVTDYCCSYFS